MAALPLKKVMTKEKTQGDELSAIGKQSMARAYSAIDYYLDDLKKTVASAPSGGTEFGEKVKVCAEQNISATQEFVRDLSYAKDIKDILRIQMEFMRSQLEAFGEQAKDLGEAYIKAASGQMRSRPREGDACAAFINPTLEVSPIARSRAMATISLFVAATGWMATGAERPKGSTSQVSLLQTSLAMVCSL